MFVCANLSETPQSRENYHWKEVGQTISEEYLGVVCLSPARVERSHKSWDAG